MLTSWFSSSKFEPNTHRYFSAIASKPNYGGSATLDVYVAYQYYESADQGTVEELKHMIDRFIRDIQDALKDCNIPVTIKIHDEGPQ